MNLFTNFPNATPETVWATMQETDRIVKENAESIKETERIIKETTENKQQNLFGEHVNEIRKNVKPVEKHLEDEYYVVPTLTMRHPKNFPNFFCRTVT